MTLAVVPKPEQDTRPRDVINLIRLGFSILLPFCRLGTARHRAGMRASGICHARSIVRPRHADVEERLGRNSLWEDGASHIYCFGVVGRELDHRVGNGSREPSPQNQILISSSLTADGSSTPDSVIMPEMRSGGV